MITDALLADFSVTLGIPKSRITITSLSVGSLVVTFTVVLNDTLRISPEGINSLLLGSQSLNDVPTVYLILTGSIEFIAVTEAATAAPGTSPTTSCALPCIIGIAAGCAVAAAGCVVVGVLCWRRRRNRRIQVQQKVGARQEAQFEPIDTSSIVLPTHMFPSLPGSPHKDAAEKQRNNNTEDTLYVTSRGEIGKLSDESWSPLRRLQYRTGSSTKRLPTRLAPPTAVYHKDDSGTPTIATDPLDWDLGVDSLREQHSGPSSPRASRHVVESPVKPFELDFPSRAPTEHEPHRSHPPVGPFSFEHVVGRNASSTRDAMAFPSHAQVTVFDSDCEDDLETEDVWDWEFAELPGEAVVAVRPVVTSPQSLRHSPLASPRPRNGGSHHPHHEQMHRHS